jgi:hypothetical protein
MSITCFFTSSFSYADKQGASLVVARIQRKSAPLSIKCSTKQVNDLKSTLPSEVNGVTSATPSPLNIFRAIDIVLLYYDLPTKLTLYIGLPNNVITKKRKLN